MAEVTLSDYLAFLLSEVSRARDMADRYTREIALVYAKDDVLRHFSVPRFKLAKMELNIPVLVSGVEISSLVQFPVTTEDFRSFMTGKLVALVTVVRQVITVRTSIPMTVNGTAPVRTKEIEPLIDAFHDRLASTSDPLHPESLIREQWSTITSQVLALNNIPGELVGDPTVAGLIAGPLPTLIQEIKTKLSVPKATIERLMINPQTNVVKDGSSDASVFTIKAELIEEGVTVKSVKDEETGIESPVVEFE